MSRQRIIFNFVLAGMLVMAVAGRCEITKLVFVTPAEDITGATRILINQFNTSHPNIQVEHRMLSASTDACHNYYVTAFLSKDDSFDVFSGDIIWIPEFASNHWIKSLEPYFPPAERGQFIPGTIAGCTYEGQIWAVPWFTDSGVLFFRKDLVKTPPATWDQLIDAARSHMNRGTVKYGYVFQGNEYEGLVCNVLEFIWNNGGDVFAGDEIVINSPEAVEGLEILVQMVQEGLCPGEVIFYQEQDSRLLFQDGHALFLRNWPTVWPQLNQEGSPVQGKVGIAPLPVGPRGQTSSGALGGWNLMINRYSQNTEAAWEFIVFLSSEETQAINSIIGGRLPTRLAVYSDPDVLEANPYYQDFLKAFIASKPRPVSPFYPALSEIMQVNFHQALTGRISAQEAMNNIEQGLGLLFQP